MNTRITTAELQKCLCKRRSLLQIAHLGQIDVFFCLNVMLKISSFGIPPWLWVFLWTMSGKCLWSLNCLTRLNLCNVFSSQSQNLCVFNWCYGFSKHCSVSHHRLPFCSYVSLSSHLSPYELILTFTFVQCVSATGDEREVISVRAKTFCLFTKTRC